jgi:hypothetical protein
MKIVMLDEWGDLVRMLLRSRVILTRHRGRG